MRRDKKIAEFVRTNPQIRAFMEAWKRREHAKRTVCSECQFESSVGFEESHAPGCSRGDQ